MTWALWCKGALLGVLIWGILRAIPRLSAAERFQVWALYLISLPLLGLLPASAMPTITIHTAAGSVVAKTVAKTLRTASTGFPIYWAVAVAQTTSRL